jgi:hypothetical protein
LFVSEVLDGEEKEFAMLTQALEEICTFAGDGEGRCVHDVSFGRGSSSVRTTLKPIADRNGPH